MNIIYTDSKHIGHVHVSKRVVGLLELLGLSGKGREGDTFEIETLMKLKLSIIDLAIHTHIYTFHTSSAIIPFLQNFTRLSRVIRAIRVIGLDVIVYTQIIEIPC